MSIHRRPANYLDGDFFDACFGYATAFKLFPWKNDRLREARLRQSTWKTGIFIFLLFFLHPSEHSFFFPVTLRGVIRIQTFSAGIQLCPAFANF